MLRPFARRLAASTLALSLVIVSLARADARPRDVMNAGELRLALRKLQVTGSALYVGAHPDDENTAMLSMLASGRMVRTAYLSLTRGDGGQNLLGTETGELLGVIRTQELLAARRVDGAEQFFTRAVDFGFSKGPEETLAIWGNDAILADVVYVIRTFHPDVIVTRFPTDGSGGHGHHTASAILAEEAFTAAADPKRFLEQLGPAVKPWQAKRIVWNVFRPQGGPPPDSGLTVDVGGYNAMLGRSYTEIAGQSRSMHKSQGFGAPERRGSNVQALRLRAGAPATKDLFDGVDLGWSRFRDGRKVAALLMQAEREFRADHPEAIVPVLLRARAAMGALMPQDSSRIAVKTRELDEVVRSCAGLWIEATASAPSASPGGDVRVATSVVNRSSLSLSLVKIELPAPVRAATATPADGSVPPPGPELRDVPLPFNQSVVGESSFKLPPSDTTTQPYWLRQRPGKGTFAIADESLLRRPETEAPLTARVFVRVAGQVLEYPVTVAYRWTDPVAGERYRTFQVVPPVSLRLDQGVYVFPDRAAKEVRVVVRSADQPVYCIVRLTLPEGWRSEPASAPVSVEANGAETAVAFMVTPGDAPAAGTIGATVEVSGVRYDRRLVQIDYPHIPVQTLFLAAEAHLVRADIRHVGENVGYVMGSGDQIPDALRQVGYKVTLLSDDEIERSPLARFDAIVIGVRAYNTRPRLRLLQSRLLDYVRAGGTLVAQYNTVASTLENQLGPYPFKISSDRVTVEEAPVRLLKPAHALLTRPNAIGPDDFTGWVQERGLNFPNPWDPKYETVLSSNDPGETAKDGGLLYAAVGKGVYIYTGYSWFRELPAGVPGAYRLFVNLVSARQ
jgi:LmbE family N-acetylglucosaminyl deacetylase